MSLLLGVVLPSATVSSLLSCCNFVMGVRRLFSDLQPLAESVRLGSATSPSSDIANITSLVVDGPSLIYHVYSKLLNYKLSGCHQMLPTYAEVNESTKCYLETLKDHGVIIQSLFFDGALPTHKREERLNRLEQSRRELEHYRRTNHNLHTLLVTKPLSADDHYNALWRATAASYRQQLPPAPPLMVASAIEALRLDSIWQDAVLVVPEEADIACARAVSCIDGAAVLSNDSDLALYDIGPGNRLIFLNSLEMQEQTPPQLTHIYGQAIDPSKIAVRFRVPSMLRFGFERYLNSSTSTAIIVQNARDDSRCMSMEHEYETFSAQYQTSQQGSIGLDGSHFDPRIAEIYNQVHASVEPAESVCIYLPILHEDSMRTSSWSYGTDLRQAAYSLIGHNASKAFREYARKGARIADTIVTTLNGRKLLRMISQIMTLLEAVTRSENDQPLAVCAGLKVIAWWTLALHVVISTKLSGGQEANMQSAERIFGVGSTSLEHAVVWDDLHLHANAQAVLYSLRILKQVLSRDAALDDADVPVRYQLDQLKRRLHGMPTIADLFLDPWRLRELAVSVGSESMSMVLAPIRDLLQQSSGSSRSSSASRHATDDLEPYGPLA